MVAMLPRSTLVAFLACGVAAGCARSNVPANAPPAAPGSQPTARPEAKFDMEAMLKREIAIPGARHFQVETLQGDVAAVSDPKGKRDGHLIAFEFPIGTAATVTCQTFDARVDPGALMSGIAKAVDKDQSLRLVEVTDVYPVGDYGAFAAHMIYMKQQAVGELKLFFYAHPLTPTLCLHDELGYFETAKRVTSGLFASMARADRRLENQPNRWSLAVEKINGKPIGFIQEIYWAAGKGVTAVETQSMTLQPRSPTQFTGVDSFSVVRRREAGELLECRYAKANNAETEVDVDLKRLGPTEYGYDGKHKGKAISGKFKTKDKAGLATGRRVERTIRDVLLSGKAKTFKTEEFSPGTDPTAPVEVTYETESLESRKVRMRLGPMQISSTVDPDGSPVKLEMDMGSFVVTIERLRDRVAR
jgi:hypothetical protein